MCNAEDYEKYTRCKKESVDHFLSELQKRSIDTWLRQVIVKGINDSADSVKTLYEVADAHSCVKKVELLKFRKLCTPKYENLGIEFPFGNIPETTAQEIENLKDRCIGQ
jgi:pyruvate formate lyase activating enzyme